MEACTEIPLGYDRNRPVCWDGGMSGSIGWSCPLVLRPEVAAAGVGDAGAGGGRPDGQGLALAYATCCNGAIGLSAINDQPAHMERSVEI